MINRNYSRFNYGSNSNRSKSNTGSSSVNGASEKERESLNQMYKNVDGENKLKGNLFSKLIKETNEVINKANTTKQNTKI